MRYTWINGFPETWRSHVLQQLWPSTTNTHDCKADLTVTQWQQHAEGDGLPCDAKHAVTLFFFFLLLFCVLKSALSWAWNMHWQNSWVGNTVPIGSGWRGLFPCSEVAFSRHYDGRLPHEENWCSKRLKHGDCVKKLSGNVRKYWSDHPFFDRFPLAWRQATQNLLAEKNKDVQSLMSATRREKKKKKRRLNSDWFTERRHFAWLTLATLPHPGAFRGRDVLDCVCSLPVLSLCLFFVGNYHCTPRPSCSGCSRRKSSNPEHEHLWQVDTIPLPWSRDALLFLWRVFWPGDRIPPHRCFCCARHFFTACLRRNGVARLFSLCMSFSCIGNACPFLGLLVLRVKLVPKLLLALSLLLSCEAPKFGLWADYSCLACSFFVCFTFQFCFGNFRGTSLVAIVQLILYSGCFLFTRPDCRAFSSLLAACFHLAQGHVFCVI